MPGQRGARVGLEAAPTGPDRRRLTTVRRDRDRPLRSNLPAPLTSFVGRREEIAALADRLGETRLLTLTGIGGIGKSRLALEVARQTPSRIVEEVWLAELAGIVDPDHLGGTIAAVLGVRAGGDQPVVEAIIRSLACRPVLLVLDNCEHLIEAAADLVLALLRGCPGLRILATSRIPLGVSGEANWRVAPLPTPDLDCAPDLAGLAENPAVQLFVERARSAQASFGLTAENAQDVVRVCARLDGIPLAIELAAARMAVLSPRQIGDRLHDRFRWLVHDGRDAPARQRTLRATLDWSYALLSGDEQALLRRLSVFVGGFGLEAAEGVGIRVVGARGREACRGTQHQAPTTLALLAGLVKQSLVMTDDRQGERRYRLLETVRQYGWEQLQAAGELDDARRWHRDWLLAMAEANERRTWGQQQVAAFDWFALELDDLRAAMEWCEIEGAADLGLRLGASLWRFWDVRGQSAEGRARLTRLLDLAGPEADRRARSRVLWEVGILAFCAGDADAAVASWRESLHLGRAARDQIAVMFATYTLATVEQLRGNGAAAQRLLAAAVAEPPRAGDLGARLLLAYARGYLAVQRGDLDQGEADLREGVEIGRSLGESFVRAHCLSTLGQVALLRGDLDQASRYLVEALRLRSELKSSTTLTFTIEKLGWLAAKAGDGDQAGRLLGAAAALRARGGSELYPYEIDGHRDAERAARAALGDHRFERAYAAGASLTAEQIVELALRLGSGPAACHDDAVSRSAARLSRRRWQIARLVARGLTNRQIADALVIQESTVGNHLQRIYTLLEINGRAQLAAWVAQHDPGDEPLA